MNPNSSVNQTSSDVSPSLADFENAVLYKMLLDNVSDYAIFALDPAGTVLTWNTGAERILGYSANEAVGTHFSQFFVEADLKANKPADELKDAREHGKFETESWRIRKDGTLFWADVVVTPIFNAQRIITGFAKVMRDLTERKIAEETLRRSEETFRLMVSSVQDYAIFLLNVDGNIMTWNEGAQRLKGYSESEIIGSHFSRFYSEEAKATNHPAHELELATKNGHYEEEGWRIRKDGSQFWASALLASRVVNIL